MQRTHETPILYYLLTSCEELLGIEFRVVGLEFERDCGLGAVDVTRELLAFFQGGGDEDVVLLAKEGFLIHE